MSNRRSFLQRVFGVGAGLIAAPALANAKPKVSTGAPVTVETPDVAPLPFHMEGGVKVFHLIAEPVRREIMPGRVLELWGYNGSVPGPTIQANRGDRVRIVFENRLPEPTSIHWHGLEIPIAMDGMPYISQKPVAPGQKFNYEFTLHQEGTFFYHSHNSMQQMQGMIGMFILHPQQAWAPRVDRDFGFVLQEFAALPSNNIPNSMAMEFNWLTFNGKVAPATTPVLVKQGERVRMRFTNMGMDHHPIHLHGMTFTVTGTEAGRQPESTWLRKNTVLVGVAEAVDFEFVADNPGDWMVHCHLPHHMMNGMASTVGPITRGEGGAMAGVGSMNSGMGMPQGGAATSDEYAPALGRGLGFNSSESPTPNGPLDAQQANQVQAGGQHGVLHNAQSVAKNANDVPGFPQDAFMEMVMDEHVEKPENYGLAKGWSAGMMGMMTLVRVLTPQQYDHIMALKQRAPKQQPEEHKHHG
jgi:manganese oxidase